LTISPYTSNALADLGTINFRFFTNQRENQGAEFTSRLPVFYVIHMIIRSYLEYKRLGDTHDSII
jgi:DNA-binding MurR/RpiR family transcriptional regulator